MHHGLDHPLTDPDVLEVNNLGGGHVVGDRRVLDVIQQHLFADLRPGHLHHLGHSG